jgi:hypothetical protein
MLTLSKREKSVLKFVNDRLPNPDWVPARGRAYILSSEKVPIPSMQDIIVAHPGEIPPDIEAITTRLTDLGLLKAYPERGPLEVSEGGGGVSISRPDCGKRYLVTKRGQEEINHFLSEQAKQVARTVLRKTIEDQGPKVLVVFVVLILGWLGISTVGWLK